MNRMNRKINERMSGGPAVRDSFMTRKRWRVANVVIIGASSTPLNLRPATSKLREQYLLSVKMSITRTIEERRSEIMSIFQVSVGS